MYVEKQATVQMGVNCYELLRIVIKTKENGEADCGRRIECAMM